MLSFFPRGVLDEILNLIESVSEGFPSYSLTNISYAAALVYLSANDKSHRKISTVPFSPDMFIPNKVDCYKHFLVHLFMLSRPAGEARINM